MGMSDLCEIRERQYPRLCLDLRPDRSRAVTVGLEIGHLHHTFARFAVTNEEFVRPTPMQDRDQPGLEQQELAPFSALVAEIVAPVEAFETSSRGDCLDRRPVE